jgi:hypothetical protein
VLFSWSQPEIAQTMALSLTIHCGLSQEFSLAFCFALLWFIYKNNASHCGFNKVIFIMLEPCNFVSGSSGFSLIQIFANELATKSRNNSKD